MKMKMKNLNRCFMIGFMLVLQFFGLWNESRYALAKESAPAITISPQHGQTGVKINSSFVIQFAEPVKLANGEALTSKNAATIFTIKTAKDQSDVEVQVKWSPTYKRITVEPKQPLHFDTRYVLAIARGKVKNKAGIVNEAVLSEFTTEAQEPPLSVVFSPQPNATEVPIETTITLTFNKHMLLANKKEINDIAISTFLKLNDNKQKRVPFTGYWNGDTQTVTIDPEGNLAPGSTYTITLLANKLVDSQGAKNPEINSQFSTKVPVDLIPPTITSTPSHGAKDVSLTAPVVLQFAEEVVLANGESLTNKSVANLVLFQDQKGQEVKYYATWNKTKRTITLRLKEKMAPYTTYMVQLPAGMMKDIAGNTNGNFTASFSTKGN